MRARETNGTSGATRNRALGVENRVAFPSVICGRRNRPALELRRAINGIAVLFLECLIGRGLHVTRGER